MRLFFTILIMVFINFGASARETIYNCIQAEWKIKVEDPLFGKKKIFVRNEGVWLRSCTKSPKSVVQEESFKCFFIGEPNFKYYIFDEKFKTLNFHRHNGEIVKTTCY